MEPNSNFSYDSSNVNKMKGSFKDKNGESSVIMEGSEAPLNMPNNVTLANRPSSQQKNVQISNIGPGSNGFAGVALLAGVVALAGILIAYITLRY